MSGIVILSSIKFYGFILTNGEGKNNVCGYALNDNHKLHEYDLLALRLIREDGCDEDYKSACAKYGWDLSLEQFVSEFNADGPFAPTNESHYIRIY